MRWVDVERSALAETFRVAGPDAPTLCAGWQTRHLLAHLVQRENHPLANVADQISRRPPGQEVQLGKLVATTRTDGGWDRLISRFAAGPHRWSPMSWAGEQLNLLEFVIHHEDVRRGAGPVASPALPAEEEQALFRRMPVLARFAYRGAPVGVVLAPGVAEPQTVAKGARTVELRGGPVELALFLSGRRDAAEVELVGADADVAAFTAWLDR